MGRIKNEDLYILDQLVSGNDRLIGSDGDDLKKTKNFSVDDLLGYFQNNNPTDYVLPIATDVILGGVTVDNDSILITVDGELSSPFPVKQNDIIGSIYWDYFRDEANYADQAFGSIDLSISFTPSVLYGSGGQYSFSSGTNVEASGYGSRAHGEEVSSTNTFGVTFGYQNVNNGYASFVAGYSNIENSSTGYGLVFGNNNTSATNSGLMAGVDLISSNGVGTAILGTANLNVNGANNGTSLTQPMIIVGNGTHTTPIGSPWTASVRSNLLVGLRNGEVTLPSTTISVINGESTGKVLITREWIEGQSFLTSAPTPTLDQVTDAGNTTTNQVFLGKVWTSNIQNNDTGNLLISGNQGLILRNHNPNDGEVLITANGATSSLTDNESQWTLRCSRAFNDGLVNANVKYIGMRINDTVNMTTKTGSSYYTAIYIDPALSGTNNVRSITSLNGDAYFSNGFVQADAFRLNALNTAPASAADTGTTGEIRIDADFIYVCTATNTWKRTAIATW